MFNDVLFGQEWIEGWEERWKDALSWEDPKAGAYQARDSR